MRAALLLAPVAVAFVVPTPRTTQNPFRPDPVSATVARAPGERVLIPAERVRRVDRRLRHGGRELARAARLWLPFAANVGGGAAALVGLGAAGVGGLTATAGWTLAKTHTATTLAWTAWAALRFCLLGRDGAYVANMLGGKPAAPGSRAARVVADVVTSLAADDARRGGDAADDLAAARARELAARPPRVFVIPTAEPNAFAAGRGAGTVVAVTDGLLRLLTWEELRAVVAHEIGHVRHADVGHHMQQAAMAAGFGGAMDLGWAIVRSELNGGGKARKRTKARKRDGDDDDEGSALVPGLALMGVGAAQYATGTLLRLATSREDEFAADAVAARVPGGAEALARALRKIEAAARAGAPRDALGKAPLASCYIANSAAHDRPSRVSDWLRTHPTTERRVARLEALAAARDDAAADAPSEGWDDDDAVNWGSVLVDTLEPPSLVGR